MIKKSTKKYRFENVVCERVVDGDTIDVSIDFGFKLTLKTRLRLYRINAYESRTRDLEEKKKGLAGKKFLKELIEGKQIEIETIKTGKFGRIVAEIEYENQNVNDLLVLKKHAEYRDY